MGGRGGQPGVVLGDTSTGEVPVTLRYLLCEAVGFRRDAAGCGAGERAFTGRHDVLTL